MDEMGYQLIEIIDLLLCSINDLMTQYYCYQILTKLYTY